MPLTLIGSAVSQVYLPHAAHLNRGEELTNLTQMLLRSIINIGIGPILLLGMISEIIFPLILGDNWARVGAIIKWMTPWLLLQLLVSPISTVMHVTERQHVALYLNIFGLAIRIIPICILIALDSMKYFAEVFSIVSALYYLTWLNWCLKVTNLSVTQLITKKSLIIVCTWLAIGQIISRNLSN
jgi:O-antigen/teichoic acid export membrane protein